MTDLRTLVVKALDDSPDANPHDVARTLADTLKGKAMRDALYEALPHYVVKVATLLRAGSPVEPEQPEEQPQNGSPRWDRVAGLLARRECTEEGWKFLRNCTADNLRAAALDRRSRATSLVIAAERYEKIAVLLDEHGAATVGDLPAHLLEEVFDS